MEFPKSEHSVHQKYSDGRFDPNLISVFGYCFSDKGNTCSFGG